jgi:hypothetical protein
VISEGGGKRDVETVIWPGVDMRELAADQERVPAGGYGIVEDCRGRPRHRHATGTASHTGKSEDALGE